MRRWSGLCVIVLLLAAAPAGAQVDCGAVLGPGGSFVATADIGPCVEDPAMTIVGPVKVDFAGFRVTCESEFDEGIVIEGKGAKVSNGSVTRCDLGVRVAGEGKHVVVQMSAEQNEERGFVVESDGNKLEHNLAFRNGEGSFVGVGFDVNGVKNKLTENWSVANGDDGFEIDGASCKLTGNIAVANENVAIRSNGAKGKFKENYAGANENDGFAVASNSTFTKDVSSGNTRGGAANGYYLSGAVGAKLSKEVAVGNDGSGYSTFSSADDLTIRKVLALGNDKIGIAIIAGSTENTIKGSTAIGNGINDLFDGNVDCDMNTWSKNRFGHAIPAACIE